MLMSAKQVYPGVCYHGDMVDNICPTESKNVNIRDKINSEPEFFIQGQCPTLTNTVLTGSTCGKALG